MAYEERETGNLIGSDKVEGTAVYGADNQRIGSHDGAETHAYVRARRIVKSHGATWDHEVLLREFKRQLEDAADGVCPHCAGQRGFAPAMT